MLTKDQYTRLAEFENGRVFSDWFSPEGESVRWLLEPQGYIREDAQTCPDYFILTEPGRSALAEYREKIAEAEEEQREKNRAEAVRLKERVEDRANEVRDKHRDHVHNFLMVLLGSALTLLVEHSAAIVSFLHSLFASPH